MKKMTYDDLFRRYQKLSCENTDRLRISRKRNRYEFAAARERLLRKAFFADCKRYLTPDDIF